MRCSGPPRTSSLQKRPVDVGIGARFAAGQRLAISFYCRAVVTSMRLPRTYRLTTINVPAPRLYHSARRLEDANHRLGRRDGYTRSAPQDFFPITASRTHAVLGGLAKTIANCLLSITVPCRGRAEISEIRSRGAIEHMRGRCLIAVVKVFARRICACKDRRSNADPRAAWLLSVSIVHCGLQFRRGNAPVWKQGTT